MIDLFLYRENIKANRKLGSVGMNLIQFRISIKIPARHGMKDCTEESKRCGKCDSTQGPRDRFYCCAVHTPSEVRPHDYKYCVTTSPTHNSFSKCKATIPTRRNFSRSCRFKRVPLRILTTAHRQATAVHLILFHWKNFHHN